MSRPVVRDTSWIIPALVLLATILGGLVFFSGLFGCGGGGGGVINPPPAIRVIVNPNPAVTRAGGTDMTLTAQVQNDQSNRGVTWTFVPGTAGGSFANGVYTPPAFMTSSTSASATATSVADPTKSDTITINVDPNGGSGNISIRSPHITEGAK